MRKPELSMHTNCRRIWNLMLLCHGSRTRRPGRSICTWLGLGTASSRQYAKLGLRTRACILPLAASCTQLPRRLQALRTVLGIPFLPSAIWHDEAQSRVAWRHERQTELLLKVVDFPALRIYLVSQRCVFLFCSAERLLEMIHILWRKVGVWNSGRFRSGPFAYPSALL